MSTWFPQRGHFFTVISPSFTGSFQHSLHFLCSWNVPQLACLPQSKGDEKQDKHRSVRCGFVRIFLLVVLVVFFGGVGKTASVYLCNIKNDVLYISICYIQSWSLNAIIKKMQIPFGSDIMKLHFIFASDFWTIFSEAVYYSVLILVNVIGT